MHVHTPSGTICVLAYWSAGRMINTFLRHTHKHTDARAHTQAEALHCDPPQPPHISEEAFK